MTVGRVARGAADRIAGLVVRSSAGKVADKAVNRSVGRAVGMGRVVEASAVSGTTMLEIPNCISPHRH